MPKKNFEKDLASLKALAVIDPYADLARGEDGKLMEDANGDLIFIAKEKRPTVFPCVDHPGAMIVSAEDGKGFANYYGQYEGEFAPFDPWVHPAIMEWAVSNGYEVDWRDPGSVILYPS